MDNPRAIAAVFAAGLAAGAGGHRVAAPPLPVSAQVVDVRIEPVDGSLGIDLDVAAGRSHHQRTLNLDKDGKQLLDGQANADQHAAKMLDALRSYRDEVASALTDSIPVGINLGPQGFGLVTVGKTHNKHTLNWDADGSHPLIDGKSTNDAHAASIGAAGVTLIKVLRDEAPQLAETLAR